MSAADAGRPFAEELERQVRERLAPVCRHLSPEEFDLLVGDVVAVKTKFLHLHSDIGLPQPMDGKPQRSLAQRMGAIPHMRQRSAVPPLKPRD
jgi:hypothetical protein